MWLLHSKWLRTQYKLFCWQKGFTEAHTWNWINKIVGWDNYLPKKFLHQCRLSHILNRKAIRKKGVQVHSQHLKTIQWFRVSQPEHKVIITASTFTRNSFLPSYKGISQIPLDSQSGVVLIPSEVYTDHVNKESSI